MRTRNSTVSLSYRATQALEVTEKILLTALCHTVTQMALYRALTLCHFSHTARIKRKIWNLSFTLVLNTVIWLMAEHIFATIMISTAQRYLKKQQDLEMSAMNQSLLFLV